MCATPWAVAAAAVAAAGAIGGAVISSDASKSAAASQVAAAQNATQLQAAEFNQTQANLAPFLQAGQGAVPVLQGLLGTGGQAPNNNAFTSSPGYQFTLNQGTQAVRNAAAASGGVNSGNTLKALTQYGEGLASNTYQQYLANIQQLAGVGQNAAVAQGGFAQNFGAQAGSNIIGAGNALAAGQIGSANAINAGIGGLSQNFLNGAALYNQMNQGNGTYSQVPQPTTQPVAEPVVYPSP